MAKATIDIRSLARSHTKNAVAVLAGIMMSSADEGARVRAASTLLDRGWGKAAQPIEADGELKIIVSWADAK